MAEFKYAPMFQLGKDETEYYLLTKDHVRLTEVSFQGSDKKEQILMVEPEALTLMAQQAFHDVSFMLRRSHNEQVAKILRDPEASANDKYVALTFLRNAEVACKGQLPLCQDTGTAIIHGEKGQHVWTGFEDEEALSRGVYNTYTECNLRYSQNAPLNMYDEVNTKCNLPAQIDLEATEGMEYRFLCVTKGGGSANKTYLYQETKARIQNPGTLIPFLVEIPRNGSLSALPHRHRYRRYFGREEPPHREARFYPLLRLAADYRRRDRKSIPRCGVGETAAAGGLQDRSWCAVRR